MFPKLHLRQCEEKLMNEIWENRKNHNFGTNFGPFGPNFDHKDFLVVFKLTGKYALLQIMIVGNLKES